MAKFQKRKSFAQRTADKRARLDTTNSVDARREKQRMVKVPHLDTSAGSDNNVWRPRRQNIAKGKATVSK